MLDAVARQRIDPREFVERFNEGMARAALRRLGEALGESMNNLTIEADRERLIDEARD